MQVSRQIGWSQESNLLYQILKQLNQLTSVIFGLKPKYKVYTALLTQEGENAPVAIILENTLGVDIVWTRLSTGFYRATPSESIFLENKTFHFVNSNNQGVNFEVESFLNDTDDWRIQVSDTGEVVDSSLQNLPIEIRVYN